MTTNLTNWNYYYNLEGHEYVRANLVYTPYVSPDKQTFCMSFNRDPKYHFEFSENKKWTDELLLDRFNRELLFRQRASSIPNLGIKDVDFKQRRIFLEWHGDDFYMQGLSAGGYDNVLPDWQTQIKTRIQQMWDLGFVKCSLHPNSWVAKDGVLIPFNWFFCFDVAEQHRIRDLLIQVSAGRLEKLLSVLEQNDLDIEDYYTAKQLQKITLNSFRANYPSTLIDTILQNDFLQ